MHDCWAKTKDSCFTRLCSTNVHGNSRSIAIVCKRAQLACTIVERKTKETSEFGRIETAQKPGKPFGKNQTVKSIADWFSSKSFAGFLCSISFCAVLRIVRNFIYKAIKKVLFLLCYDRENHLLANAGLISRALFKLADWASPITSVYERLWARLPDRRKTKKRVFYRVEIFAFS